MKVDEARKLLGPDYNQMSDKQIEDIIGLVSAVCHIVVDDYTKDQKACMKKLNGIKKISRNIKKQTKK